MKSLFLQLLAYICLIALSVTFAQNTILSIAFIIFPIWLFHWAIYNPNYVNPYILLIFSFIAELTLGISPGLLSLPLAVSWYAITSLRIQLYPLPFRRIWLGYGLYMIIFSILSIFVNNLMYKNAFFMTSVILSGAISICLYPVAIGLIVLIFGRGVKRNG